MHLGGLGGSYGTGTMGSSDWTLLGGDKQTLLAMMLQILEPRALPYFILDYFKEVVCG